MRLQLAHAGTISYSYAFSCPFSNSPIDSICTDYYTQYEILCTNKAGAMIDCVCFNLTTYLHTSTHATADQSIQGGLCEIPTCYHVRVVVFGRIRRSESAGHLRLSLRVPELVYSGQMRYLHLRFRHGRFNRRGSQGIGLSAGLQMHLACRRSTRDEARHYLLARAAA